MHREIQSKMFSLIIKYIKANYVLFGISIYILFSALLNALTGIDICIPCIWKTLFKVSCPGCGLTTALMNLLELNIKQAFESNWLIFVVLPTGVYYLIRDFKKYKQNTTANSQFAKMADKRL